MSPKLPAGWQWVPLTASLEDRGRQELQCDERPPIGAEHGIVKVSAVTWGTMTSESKTITDAGKINEAYLIQPGDFLFSRANTLQLVGACVLVQQTQSGCCLATRSFARHARRIETVGALVSSFGEGQRQIEALSTGNQESMRNIGQERIGQIECRCRQPTMQSIVSRIEELFSEIDEGERALERAMKPGARYRQSVLKAAFSGQLVPKTRRRTPLPALLARLAGEATPKGTQRSQRRSPRPHHRHTMTRSAEDLFAGTAAVDESHRIEAKRASQIDRSTMETVVAFSNEPGLGGGYLLLGVERDPTTCSAVPTAGRRGRPRQAAIRSIFQPMRQHAQPPGSSAPVGGDAARQDGAGRVRARSRRG